jgi:hypothetical protein
MICWYSFESSQPLLALEKCHHIIQRDELEIENIHSMKREMPQEQHPTDDNAPPKTWHQFGCRIAHPECGRFPS